MALQHLCSTTEAGAALDGAPRHWLSARRHVADWRAAVRCVRANMTDVIDANRLCLWGTSFAGGHVLVVASEPEFAPLITAVIAQVGLMEQ